MKCSAFTSPVTSLTLIARNPFPVSAWAGMPDIESQRRVPSGARVRQMKGGRSAPFSSACTTSCAEVSSRRFGKKVPAEKREYIHPDGIFLSDIQAPGECRVTPRDRSVITYYEEAVFQSVEHRKTI